MLSALLLTALVALVRWPRHHVTSSLASVDADLAPPAPLGALLAVAFLGSVSGGAFWAGLFFVTAGHYHFSEQRNLVLAALMGAVSMFGARASATIARRFSPRGALAGALMTWALVSLMPSAFPRAEWLLWATAIVGCTCGGVIWPVVESALAAGRHGTEMRSALGWFNVTWTSATTVPLLILPLVSRWGLTASLALAAAMNTLALLAVRVLPRRSTTHHADTAASAAKLGVEYRWLLRSSAWLLPASYVISSALSPVLPHRIAQVMTSGYAASQVAALWMGARFFALVIMWRARFWHGRWETLAVAGFALLGGLAAVLLTHSAFGLIAGLLLYGAGMGITYFAALYYSMAVGHAAIDAGGNFEALIGLGYCIGPLLALTGHLVSSPTHADSTIVIFMWSAAALASPGILRPYFAARAQRRD